MSKHNTPTYLCTCTCLYIAYTYIYILTLQVISRRSGGPRCRGHTLLKPWIKKPKVRVCLTSGLFLFQWLGLL